MSIYERQLSDLLVDLTNDGGAIVCSSQCSELEISHARIQGRFAVTEEGLGFVRRPQQWLEAIKGPDEQPWNSTRRLTPASHAARNPPIPPSWSKAIAIGNSIESRLVAIEASES